MKLLSEKAILEALKRHGRIAAYRRKQVQNFFAERKYYGQVRVNPHWEWERMLLAQLPEALREIPEQDIPLLLLGLPELVASSWEPWKPRPAISGKAGRWLGAPEPLLFQLALQLRLEGKL